MWFTTDVATLALTDVTSTRLMRALSQHGPITPGHLGALLALPPQVVHIFLDCASKLGVIAADSTGCYRVEPAILAAVVRRNRDQLFGGAQFLDERGGGR